MPCLLIHDVNVLSPLQETQNSPNFIDYFPNKEISFQNFASPLGNLVNTEKTEERCRSMGFRLRKNIHIF